MSYIRLYFLTHLKHWWMYLISVVTFFFGSIISMIMIWLLGSAIHEIAGWVIGLFVGSLLISSPLFYVNYKVAASYVGDHNRRRILRLAICNHLVTYMIYNVLYILQWNYY